MPNPSITPDAPRAPNAPPPAPSVAPRDPFLASVARARRRAILALAAAALAAALSLATQSRDLPWSPASAPRAWWAAAALLALLAGMIALVRTPRPDRPGPSSPLARAWANASGVCALLALALGLAAWTAHRTQPPSDGVASILSAQAPSDPDAPILIDAIALIRERPAEVAPPPPWARAWERSARLRVRLLRLDGPDASPPSIRVAEDAWVRVGLRGTARADDLPRPGTWVRLRGSWRPIEGPTNPGEPDRRPRAAQERLAGFIALPTAELIEAIPEPTDASRRERWLASWWGVRGQAQQRAQDVLHAAGARATPEGAALLQSLVLGIDDASQRELREAFTRLGLLHVLAISGFHVTLLAWLAWIALRSLRPGGWAWEPVIVIALVLAYAAIVPAGSPIARAAAMVAVLAAADALGRRYDPLTILAWVGVGLVIWRPTDVTSLGFQLSLGMTALLLWQATRFEGVLLGVPLRGIRRREPTTIPGLVLVALGRWIRASIAAATLCWVVAAPIVAYHAGLVSPLGILATILVTPLIVALLAVGYAAVILGVAISAFVGSSPMIASWALAPLADLAARGVIAADTLPGSSLRVPPLPLLWCVLATLLALAWTLAPRRADPRLLVAAAILAAWVLAAAWRSDRLAPGVLARVDAFDIGNGTCFLVRTPGHAVLWDAGPAAGGSLRPRIAEAARALGVWRVPLAVVTHPDTDHFSGLPDLLRPLGIRRVLISDRFAQQALDRPTQPPAALLAELARLRITHDTVAAGDQIPMGPGASWRFLGPPRDELGPGDTASDNDRSLVAALVLAEGTPQARTILLTGDVAAEGIAGVAPAARTLARAAPIAIIEVPHHGSAHPDAIAWLRDLLPTLALQSSGPGRGGDERWAPVREAIAASGGAWRNTAHVGWTWAEVLADGSVRWGPAPNVGP